MATAFNSDFRVWTRYRRGRGLLCVDMRHNLDPKKKKRRDHFVLPTLIQQKSGGGRWGSREVERLLLSSSKSTVNNAGNYHGRQNRRRKGERKKEGRRRRINIAAPCQTNIRRKEKSSFTFCNGEREELPFGSYCLHAIAPQSSSAFLRGRPSEPSDPGGHGRERKRKCSNCESLDPADLAAGHNLWAHPEGKGREG